jgi:hypothetical protein
MNAKRRATVTAKKPGELVIVRLEYEQVQEDGTLPCGACIEVEGAYLVGTVPEIHGADGCGSVTAHWALVLFPRDARGNVVGWLMLANDVKALPDALPGTNIAGPPGLH